MWTDPERKWVDLVIIIAGNEIEAATFSTFTPTPLLVRYIYSVWRLQILDFNKVFDKSASVSIFRITAHVESA